MEKIAKITTQKKNKQRYNIFLTHEKGDQYSFSVDEAVLIEYGLRKGMELTGALMDELKQSDDYYKSYAMAINYLSYRMRTNKEMHHYLREKEVEENDIPKIMDRLTEEGLLNDQEFAEAFVNTRISTSSKGPQLVKRELIEKGIAVQIADETIKMYTYAVQYEKAMKWAQKRMKTTKRDSLQKQHQKMQATLMQKGFTPDVIGDVLKEVKHNQNTDGEWEALSYHGDRLLRRHGKKLSGYELKLKLKEGLVRQGFPFDKITKFVEEQAEEWDAE